MSNIKTFYSTDDEIFNKESIGDVVDALNDEHEIILGMEYFSHEFKLVSLKQYLSTSNILEDADQYLYDNVGNEDGDFDVFTDVSEEAKAELTELLNKWVDKHLSNKNIYEPIGKSTTHVIMQEDID